MTDARALAVAALKGIDFEDEAAAVTADHLVDAALRGVTFGSLPRILAIAEKMRDEGDNRKPIKVIRETPVSALLDGGDQVGYYVAHRATTMAIDKAKKSGIAIVGANNTFYTGLFSYYMEMATREGLVAMAAGNGPAVVAPEGAIDGRLGTNPIAFGFPSNRRSGDLGHRHLCDHARRSASASAPRRAAARGRCDRQERRADARSCRGARRRDPHLGRASRIGTIDGRATARRDVRRAGDFAGDAGDGVPDHRRRSEDPDAGWRISGPRDGAVRCRSAARGRLDPKKPVRMPFDRSAADRKRRKAENAIEVPDRVYESLVKLAEKKK